MKTKALFVFLISLSVTFLNSQNTVTLDLFDFSSDELKHIKAYQEEGKEQKAFEALIEYFRTRDNIYHIRGHKDISHLKKHYSTGIQKTLTTADQVIDNYFLFRNDWDMEKTNIPHQFKKEIDWKAMPNGDPEWCFMLNRHKYWVDLGKAYYITGQEKYAKAFVQQVNHWIENNPLTDELKPYSWRRIEAGIRCENWMKAFEYCKHSKHITPEFIAGFLKSLHQHGDYINSAFTNFSQTSNWGVIEYHGLINLALFMPEFKSAQQWQANAIKNLTTCIKLQIMEDGTQWEQSPMYHNEVFHCYLNTILLAKRNNIELPQVLLQKTKAMAYANVSWQKPNFHQPLLGDSDDTDLRGILTTAACLFNDATLKGRAYADVDFENFLILDDRQLKEYYQLDTQEPSFLSTYLKSSGDLYMRSSWDSTANFSSLHLKKLGCGHGHDNILHFTIFANNRDYLVDGGRYSYVNNQWRELFKSSRSHNTLGVDNLPNTVYNDSWTNQHEARSVGIFTHIDDKFDYGEAINTAYQRLDDPVLTQRRLLHLKQGIWIVFDSFYGKEEHNYAQYFNFPNQKLASDESGITTTYPSQNLRIQAVKPATIELEDAWYSSEYNLKTESKRAVFSNQSTGFESFITLLYFADDLKPEYKLLPVYSRGGGLLSNKDAEAISVRIDNQEFILFVVHNSSSPANHFYQVDGNFVQGEVVLLEKQGDTTNTCIIKP